MFMFYLWLSMIFLMAPRGFYGIPRYRTGSYGGRQEIPREPAQNPDKVNRWTEYTTKQVRHGFAYPAHQEKHPHNKYHTTTP